MHSRLLQRHKSIAKSKWWFPSARHWSQTRAALPQGQKPEEAAELWGVVSEDSWKKPFPLWKHQIWMDPREAGLLLLLQPERTTDTSKRSFTSSQPHLPPNISQSQQKLACLCRTLTKAETWPLCNSLYSLLLSCWPTLLPFLCMLEAKSRYTIFKTMHIVLCVS